MYVWSEVILMLFTFCSNRGKRIAPQVLALRSQCAFYVWMSFHQFSTSNLTFNIIVYRLLTEHCLKCTQMLLFLLTIRWRMTYDVTKPQTINIKAVCRITKQCVICVNNLQTILIALETIENIMKLNPFILFHYGNNKKCSIFYSQI